MPHIVSLTTTDSEGNTRTWTGAGEVGEVTTRQPVDGKLPAQWPRVHYVHAHLVPSAEGVQP